jgi:hypothetical protein
LLEGHQDDDREEEEEPVASGAAGTGSSRGRAAAGKVAPKRGAKRPAPDSDDDDGGGGADGCEDECSDEEVAAALRRGAAKKKKAKTAAAGTGGKAAAGGKAPRAKPAAKAAPALPPAPPLPSPSCCDAATHGVLEIMLQRGALHALDVARLGCLSRFWRARAGAELEALSAAYKAALKGRPKGEECYHHAAGQACATCGKATTRMFGVRPDTLAPACSDHYWISCFYDKTQRLHVDVLATQLLPAGDAKKKFYLTPADLRPLATYSVRARGGRRCGRLRVAAATAAA